ncbi:MAG TPA: amidohydrolase [Aggregatilineaceae bacterium]|nr:amidohydrolase [Aggregatilineaceae bacterium]
MIDFKPHIAARKEDWIARRRDLHQHPELGFELPRTAGVVAAELARLGLEVQTGIGQSGVVGLLEGEAGGPTILVRADMDALPIQEENRVVYASQTPGKMHACGHDGHTTIALAVAELLSAYRSQMIGRVKFVFQPAEELGRGAAAMVADGVLREPVPDVAFGLHLWNDTPVGSVVLTDGPMMAAAGDFIIHVTGRGGHGALPHQARDPIVAASNIVLALQTIVSRNIGPLDAGVVSVTEFKAGDSFNVIPTTARLRGTIRAFQKEIIELLERRLREIAQGVASAQGCTTEVQVDQLTLPVVNSPEVNAGLRRVFSQVEPSVKLISDYRTMVAEDMSYFLDATPGTFFLVGSANPERDLDYPHHHPRFDFDESVIPLAVDLLASAVASYVIP